MRSWTPSQTEDKANTSLTEMRGGEADAAQSRALLKQYLETDTKTAKQKQDGAATMAAIAEAEGNLAAEKRSLNDNTKCLSDLRRYCQSRVQEFEIDTKDNIAEPAALGSAKAILLVEFAVVQANSRTRLTGGNDAEDGAKARALKLIEQLCRRLHNTIPILLVYLTDPDSFVEIRGMIEDVIAKLFQEITEEATQKAFCDGKTGASKLAKNAQSSAATLTDQVTTLSAEVAENDKAVREVTAIRHKEKADFIVVEKGL
ncbi:hypothetical protein N9L68_03575 [bacterium]|nr:hypothetical protein [bacterium]